MRYISRLLILCLLLCGCSQSHAAQPVFTPTETVAVQGLYDTGSNLEISSSGAVKLYPLKNRTGKALLPFGDGLLLFSEGEKTTLTLLTGDTLVPGAVKSLGFSLTAEDCTVSGDLLSYFDLQHQQTVLLDAGLEEISRIDAPKGLVGTPLFSIPENKLYYCTANAIRVWDLNTNIHRILRETPAAGAGISGIYSNGTVLRCPEADGGSRFYSAHTGALLYEEDAPMKLTVQEDAYIAAVWETNLWSLVFAWEDGERQALTPRSLSSEYFLLPGSPAIVTAAGSGKVTTLDHYDLSTGRRTATWMLPGAIPHDLVAWKDALWGLALLESHGGNVIFRWDPARTPVSDSAVYTGPHYTAGQPDQAGLQRCEKTASAIGCRYGLAVLVWEEAAERATQQGSLQPEYRVNILNRELELLDLRLSRFPAGMLETTAGNFPALTLCLVAQSSGDQIPCVSGGQTDLILSAGSTAEEELYHNLFHVMETHILSHSSAFDQWSTLNPQGFRYDYDYAANAIRDSGMYLTDQNRSFVDTFSMSYPKEDRATVFAAAMLEDQGHLFKTKAMQAKLAAICRGIREAYGLDSPEPYPWEQYLK